MKKKKEEKKFISHDKMSDELMSEQLFELSESSFWQAILKFNRSRDSEIVQTLVVIDSFKNPTEMARAQGMRIGLYDLESKVNQEIEKRKKKEESSDEEKVTQGY